MRALSLFSGIGGIDLAAEWAGIETVAFCEYADFPRKVLNKHWPNVPIFEDVKNLNKATLEKEGVIDRNRTIELIHGGFPCQPFSLAGKGKAENDERYLWDEFFRLICEIRPRWVVGENVPGILNRGLKKTVSDLEKQKYEVWIFSVAASDVGSVHKRQRFFIVACDTNGKPVVQENTKTFTFRSEWQTWQSASWEHWRKFRELYWNVPEPGVCRVDDGISKGMDKNRLVALGNAVVPQQAYPIFEAIMEIERVIYPTK